MTAPEELRVAYDADDAATIRALIGPMSEAERAVLVPQARELVAKDLKLGIRAVLAPLVLVAYGILPVTDIRKLGWRSNHIPRDLDEMLRRRSQERLIPIVDHLLDNVVSSAWPIVRPLVRDGVIPRPDRPSYTIAMLAATRWGRAVQLVADDPGLLEVEAWRLFEIEGGGEDSLANHEKFFGDTWGTVFRDLATADPAMRSRLLDASLAALARDFSTYRAGWFSRFHESLAPTDEERAERAEAYLGLLRSRVGPTVSFAVAALTRIQGVGRLPPPALLDRIGPVLVDAPATTAAAGLTLVGRAGADSAAHARRAAIVAANALANRSPDIQGRALALIGTLVPGPDREVGQAVAEHLPEMAASKRSAAVKLVERLDGPGGHVESIAPAVQVAESISSRPVSPIDLERAIEPIASIDGLIDVAVSVIESGEPADDVERVLDAVGRLATDRSGDFPRRTSALARRARTVLRQRDSHPFTGFDVHSDIAAVVLAWATGELTAPGSAHRSVDPGVGAFLSARAREVAVAAAAGRAFTAAARPTHRGGFLDPAVLVHRLVERPPASSLDLVAAILRIAPDGRGAALDAAREIDGEVGAAIRYALGGDESIGATAAWWVAAARARAPGQDDDRLAKRHPHLGPDAGHASRIRLRALAGRATYGGPSLEIEPPVVVAGPASPLGSEAELPTVLMLRYSSSFAWTGRSDPAMLRWIATVEPGYRETWAAAGSLTLARNVDWWSAEWANRAYLEPFVDPAAAIGPHARTLIAIALGAKEAGERGLASDIVRLAIGAGRLDAPGLAEGLSAAADVGCDRPNRWAVSLADAAGDSAAAAAVVAEAIARALPSLDGREPAKVVALLRLLDELLADTGTGASPEARPALERRTVGGGQAARLARSILARG